MAPRDNVILELGLFIGALGRQRVFMLIEQGMDVKIPTDLLGVTPIVYPAGAPGDLSARLGPACTELRAVMNARGPR
jgi:predicted nucleotide-binding protein